MNSKTFCIAPWAHTCVTPSGKLIPCCNWKGNPTHSFVDFDQWINSDELKTVRHNLHNGIKIDACSKCWIAEDIGKNSLRQSYNAEFSKYFEFSKLNNEWIADDSVVTFDFKLGNLCNLKCVMCTGNQSSQIMSEYKSYQDKFKKLNFYQAPDTDTDFGWPDSEIFYQFLNKFKDNIRWIKFTGGEPTINPYIIKALEEIPHPELVTVSLTTNGTKFNKNLVAVLSQFKKLWISVSLDGIESTNDQLRYLSSWDEVSTNALALSKLPNAYFNINYVFQCFSASTLIPLLSWCDTHELKLNMIVLDYPNYLTINSLEPSVVNDFKNCLEQTISITNQSVIDSTLELLKKYSYSDELKKQRIEYLSTLDEIRGSTLCDII